MTQLVHDFETGGRDRADLLGGKGANLAEMTRLGLPVPPGFTITTDACRPTSRTGPSRPGSSTRSTPTCARSRSGWAAGSATPTTRCSSPSAPGPASRCRG